MICCYFLKKSELLLFNLDTDNRLAQCVSLRHSERPRGFKWHNSFYNVPLCGGTMLCVFHHMRDGCSAICWEREINKLHKHITFYLALLKSTNKSCEFVKLNEKPYVLFYSFKVLLTVCVCMIVSVKASL